MADTRQSEPTGSASSSDDEIVAALQQLAHAQALLFQAENDVSSPTEDALRLGERNREIEEAHTKLLWTQAETLTAPRGDRTPKALEPHRKREQQALAKYGFATFDDYLEDRARRPTNNINLAKARREYRAAHEHWEDVLRSKGGTDLLPPAPVAARSNGAAAAAAPPSSPPPPSAPASPVVATDAPGLSATARMALGAVAVVIVVLAAFLVMKTRGGSSADAALATSPTLPVTSTTARPTPPINSIPSTKAPGASTTTAPAKPGATTTTPAAPATTAAPATPTTAGANKTAALCAAAKIYSLDDLNNLAVKAVTDPKGSLKAYETMALTAPADITAQMQALGPLTRQALGEIEKGTIKTAQELQQWLANAPQEDLAQWIKAQQAVVPVVQQLCAGT